MLLVWNEPKTLALLDRWFIGHSGWESGLRSLFYYSTQQSEREVRSMAPPLAGYGKVYLVDVRRMFQSLFRTDTNLDSIKNAARSHLKPQFQNDIPEAELGKQCAGNDSR